MVFSPVKTSHENTEILAWTVFNAKQRLHCGFKCIAIKALQVRPGREFQLRVALVDEARLKIGPNQRISLIKRVEILVVVEPTRALQVENQRTHGMAAVGPVHVIVLEKLSAQHRKGADK